MKAEKLVDGEHEEVKFVRSGSCRMVLAYHNLGNGTTFGGIRMLPADAGERAVKDALRLSEAMTYKLAIINEPFGGSKAVVIEPKEGKARKFLHEIGELVEREDGKFITAIDFGFEPDDAKVIREKTRHILAIKDTPFGQSGVTTAYGVLKGIKETLLYAMEDPCLAGKRIAVQGLGSVGKTLAEELLKEGAFVYASDPNEERVDQFCKYIAGICEDQRLGIADPEEALFLDVHVLAPCGPAYIINKETIPKLKCRAIAGGANCQLEDEVADDIMLKERGIVIAPDYAINAGGVIQGIEEHRGGTLEGAIARLGIIPKNLRKIFDLSRREGIGKYAAARQLAMQRIGGMTLAGAR